MKFSPVETRDRITALLFAIVAFGVTWGVTGSNEVLIDYLQGADGETFFSSSHFPLSVLFTSAFVHPFVLLWVPELSTQRAKALGWGFAVLIAGSLLVSLWDEFAMGSSTSDASARMWRSLPGLLLFSLATSGLRGFSHSSSCLGLIPLVATYATLILLMVSGNHVYLAGLLFAALWFPGYRRVGWIWRPTRLPRIPRRKSAASGFTLIELLIVIAILAIMVGSLMPLSSEISGALERQEVRREAIDYARDEFALLRGGADTLQLGRRGGSDALRAQYAVAAESEVEVHEGPRPELRKVRIRIPIERGGAEDPLEFVALVPLRGVGERP